jgi:hypothetical protein
MSQRLLLIVGLQKSGTTLLERLLLRSGGARVVVEGEGDELWGNVPPFSPEGFPAGAVYRRYGGDRGHEAGAEDATPEARDTLAARLRGDGGDAGLRMNKNPYNTVRLPWLRAMLPDAFIVAVVRRAVPNVYSLRKKHVAHGERGLPPEAGWWGVKPRGWRRLIEPDALHQSARQWAAVNRKLLDDAALIDDVLAYHEICADPDGTAERIVRAATGEPRWRPAVAQPSLRCFDEEFLVGSGLRSKNRYFMKQGSLETPEREALEIGPLAAGEIEMIRRECGDVERGFEALR